MNQRNHCSCHDLEADDFRNAAMAGAGTVKACFRYHGYLPRCAKCIPLVKRILNEAESDRTTCYDPTHPLLSKESKDDAAV
ncbi:MAG: (2Fe-2S)-binding protein [Nitrospirales bacterium]